MKFRQFFNERISYKNGIKSLIYVLKGKFLHYRFSFKPESKIELHNKILVGTHHKTGTVWLSSIFREICRHYSLNFYRGSQNNFLSNYDVFFQNHSVFDLDSISKPFRGVHIIRDPRDVIISGCFYHQKSKETWLHKRKKYFDNLTYQQKINSFINIDDQILFEMENAGKFTIDNMVKWDYTNPHFYEVKYEELIDDIDLEIFREVFSSLRFPESLIPDLLEIAYEKSLFSGHIGKSLHVRSGKKNQWKNYFKSHHKTRFLELFGDAIIQLNYESNNDC